VSEDLVLGEIYFGERKSVYREEAGITITIG